MCNFHLFQAYRLEPLILKHYATISPLRIHRADSPNKVPYEEMKAVAYSANIQGKDKKDGGSPAKVLSEKEQLLADVNSDEDGEIKVIVTDEQDKEKEKEKLSISGEFISVDFLLILIKFDIFLMCLKFLYSYFS